MNKIVGLTTISLAIILALSVAPANAQNCVTAGCLDDTFGWAGKVMTNINFSTGNNWANAMAIQPTDGKIVIAAYGRNYPAGTGNDFYVLRYEQDGSLDQTFGSGGVSRIAFTAAADNETPYAIAIQSNGQIVVGGSVPAGFGIARLNADGGLDMSFGSNGKVSFKFSNKESAGLNALAIQPNGSIIAFGSSANKFAFARLTSTGAFDTSFNGSGKLTVPTSSKTDLGSGGKAVALQADGKIVGTGRRPNLGGRNPTGRDFATMRLNANGTLDAGFGTGGMVFTDFVGLDDGASGVAIDGAGKIVVAGETYVSSSSYNFALVRYNQDGSLDTTFDGDGKAAAGVAGFSGGLKSVSIQSDGRIVGAGPLRITGLTVVDAAVVRFDSSGILDSTFGPNGGGIVATDFGGQDENLAIALQSDGKIVTAGLAMSGAFIAIARYLP